MAELARKFGHGTLSQAFTYDASLSYVSPALKEGVTKVDANSILFLTADKTWEGKFVCYGLTKDELKTKEISTLTNKSYVHEGDTFIWAQGKFYANAGAGAGAGAIASLVGDETYLTVKELTTNPDGSKNLKVSHKTVIEAGKKEDTTAAGTSQKVITSITVDAAGHITAVETGKAENTTYAFTNGDTKDVIKITPTTNGTEGTPVTVTIDEVEHAKSVYVKPAGSGTGTYADGTTVIEKTGASNTEIPTEKAVVDYVSGIVEGLDVAKAGADGSYIKFVEEADGLVTATPQEFATEIGADGDDTNAPTTKAVRDAIKALDHTSTGEAGSYIQKVAEADGIVSETVVAFDKTVGAASTDNNAPTSKAVYTYVSSELDALDLEQVGANGNYIKFVSQGNGQVAATKQAFDTVVGPATGDNAATDNNAPTTLAVRKAINDAIVAGVEFKGVVDPQDLPAASDDSVTNGDMYKFNKAGVVGTEDVKVGDVVIAVKNEQGSKWEIIPSGDDVDDTWRAISIVEWDEPSGQKTTEVANNSITGPRLILGPGNAFIGITGENGNVNIATRNVMTGVAVATEDATPDSSEAYAAIRFTREFDGSEESAANQTVIGVKGGKGVKTSQADNVITVDLDVTGSTTVTNVAAVDDVTGATLDLKLIDADGKAAEAVALPTVNYKSLDKSIVVSGTASTKTINIDYTGASTAEDWAEIG